MKKIFILFAMVFAFATYANAEVTEKIEQALTSAVDTAYHDGRAAVDTLYHDGKAVISTVYEDAKSGFANLYPDIKSAIMSIGHAIGIAAEHVYGVLVKKYFVLGIKQAGMCLIGLIVFIWGIFAWKKVTPVGQPITYRIIVPLILFFGGIIMMCSVNYDEMLMGLINPEYGAINYILEYTKELAK